MGGVWAGPGIHRGGGRDRGDENEDFWEGETEKGAGREIERRGGRKAASPVIMNGKVAQCRVGTGCGAYKCWWKDREKKLQCDFGRFDRGPRLSGQGRR